MPPLGIWSGQKPPAGLVRVRDSRFIVNVRERPVPAQRFENFLLNDYGITRRNGYVKRHHTALHASCTAFDGVDDYAEVDYVAADDLGTGWTQQFRINIPNVLPRTDATIYGKRTNAVNTNHFWLWLDVSTGKIRFQMDTASEAVSMTSTNVITPGTAVTITVRRDGDDIDLIFDDNAASPEDSHTLVAGSGEANKVNTARWLYGARAENASGTYADDQFSPMILSEHRDWSAARSNADIDGDYNVELPKGITANLRHYRRFRGHPNRRIVRDSLDHISQAGRRNAYFRGCGPWLVDRFYPERCGPWDDDTNPGIAMGERWERFNGVGVAAAGQHRQYIPTAGQQDMLNATLDGIAQWAARAEFISERASTLEALADWALSDVSNNPGLRLEKLANNTLQASYENSGIVTVTSTQTVGQCIPYGVDIIRRDTDFRMIIYRMDTDAIIEEVAVVVASGVGDAVADGPFTLGKRRDDSNPFQGAIGNVHVYRQADGARALARPDVIRASDAMIAITARRNGNLVLDRATDTLLDADCTPDDGDIPDGPRLAECIASVRPNDFGHFQGIYDYQAFSAESREVERILLAVHDGVIYESLNRDGVDLDLKGVRRGLHSGRTKLSDWAQYADDVFHFNGLDVNLVRDRLGRWTRNGVISPAAAPDAALGINGLLIDGATYSWFYTYYDPVTDTESLPSDVVSWTISGAGSNKKVVLGGITPILTSTDPDRPTIHRRIYRTQWDPATLTQSSKYYRVGTLEDNSTTTFTDNVADTLLVPALAIEQDEFGFYLGGTLPICRYGEEMWGSMFAGGDPEHPFRLYYSVTGRPQMFPANYWIDLIDEGTGSPITAIIKVYSRLFVFTERDIWEITPTGDATRFTANRVVRGIGASGTWGIGMKHGEVWFVNAGQRKIYRWNTGEGAPVLASNAIRPLLEELNGDALRYCFANYYEYLDMMVLTASKGTTDPDLEGDTGIPENDRLIAFDFTRGEWLELPDIDVNVLATVEQQGQERDRLYAGDYTGFIRMYDEGDNDGYDQNGDKKGLIDASGTTTTTVNLYDSAGLAASLPTAEDGVAGLYFFLLAVDATTGVRSVVDKQRIHYNPSASQVILQSALSRAPTNADQWCIGGIHARRREPELDFDRNVHHKTLRNLVFFHRLETGDSESDCVAVLKYFQDASDISSPAAEEVDLTTGEPTTNPYKNQEIWETSPFHSFEIESFFPDQPCRIDGVTADYRSYGRTVEAT
jgi:hypothetical protein